MTENFDAFWSRYPRREARKDALKAWGQVRGDRFLGEILEALDWQVPRWTDRRYVPLPATYLRGERWTDERPRQANSIARRSWHYEDCQHEPHCGGEARHQMITALDEDRRRRQA